MELISSKNETLAGGRKPRPSTREERMMLRALELAWKGAATVSPNPAVGAVIEAAGEIVGEAYHERAGEPHAEVLAVRRAGERASGATMYVTLEPCAHQGRTPPCAGMLAEAGIATVYMAMTDPNPRVSGRGARILRGRGVTVKEGPYGDVAVRMNEAYVKWITRGVPHVTLKMAMSADGKVATRDGHSRWVTSEASRRDVHHTRARSDAVMVGIGTVLADNPRLIAREVGARRQPARVVVDSRGRTPPDGHLADSGEARTIVAVSAAAPVANRRLLEGKGIEVLQAGDERRVDLGVLFGELGARQVTSVLCEGGPVLAASLLESGLVDRLVFYIAPKIIGGTDAPGPVGGTGVGLMSDALELEIDSVRDLGGDLKIVARPHGRMECSPA